MEFGIVLSTAFVIYLRKDVNRVSKSHIFPESFIVIPVVFQKIWRISPSLFIIFITFSDFLTFFSLKRN